MGACNCFRSALEGPRKFDTRIPSQLTPIWSVRGPMKVISRSRGGQVAPPPPSTMKILHLTTSGGEGEGSDVSCCGSSISSLDFNGASAVMIDVEEMSLGVERFQRQRESAAASVSLSSSARYRDVLPPTGDGQLTLPVRPSILRRPGSVRAKRRGCRPRAASPPTTTPWESVWMSDDAAMGGAGCDTTATRCSTSSSTAAETATDGQPPSGTELSRDPEDGRNCMFSSQPTRRCGGGQSFFDVARRCRCRSTSGIAAYRKFRSCRKQFVDDYSEYGRHPVAMSTTSLHQLSERYLTTVDEGGARVCWCDMVIGWC